MEIELREVSKTYRMGETHVKALRNVSLHIREGEHVSVIGPSGSGKTTLMNIMGVLDKPTKGRILLDGTDITGYPEGKLSSIRLRKFGYVFQQFYLLPTLTSFQNVYLPIREARGFGQNGKDRAMELLEKVGMKDRSRHLPSQLSGGEQQRISIARALANDPPVILADEPTGELDSENSRMIIELLRDLNKEMGKTVVIVSHDQEIARRSKRLIKMKDGMIT